MTSDRFLCLFYSASCPLVRYLSPVRAYSLTSLTPPICWILVLLYQASLLLDSQLKVVSRYLSSDWYLIPNYLPRELLAKLLRTTCLLPTLYIRQLLSFGFFFLVPTDPLWDSILDPIIPLSVVFLNHA